VKPDPGDIHMKMPPEPEESQEIKISEYVPPRAVLRSTIHECAVVGVPQTQELPLVQAPVPVYGPAALSAKIPKCVESLAPRTCHPGENVVSVLIIW
jgi:hypothetical protein